MRAVVILLMLVVVQKGYVRVRERKVYLVLAFWLLYSIRLVYEVLEHGVLVSFITNTEFLLFAYGTCFIPLFGAAMVTRQYADDLLRTSSLIFALLLISTVANTIEVLQFGVAAFRMTGRFFSASLNAISYGSLGSSLTLLCIFRFVTSALRGWRLYVTLIGVLLGVVAMILSASKGPMLATVVAAVFYLVCVVRGRDAWRYVRVVSFVVLSVGAVASVVASLSGQDPFARVSSALEGDQSTDARRRLWSDSISQYLDSPLVGSGAVEQITGYYPHNIFIEGFISTGAIGGLLLLFITTIALISARFVFRERPRLGWVPLLFIQQAVLSTVTNSIFFGSQFWILIVLTMTVGSIRISDRRPMARSYPGRS